MSQLVVNFNKDKTVFDEWKDYTHNNWFRKVISINQKPPEYGIFFGIVPDERDSDCLRYSLQYSPLVCAPRPPTIVNELVETLSIILRKLYPPDDDDKRLIFRVEQAEQFREFLDDFLPRINTLKAFL